VRFLFAGLVVSLMMMGSGYLIRDRIVPAFVKELPAVPVVEIHRPASPREQLMRAALLHALRGEFDQAAACCEKAKASGTAASPEGTRAIEEVIDAIAEARIASQEKDAAPQGTTVLPAPEGGGPED
jgi:hypothetical protein